MKSTANVYFGTAWMKLLNILGGLLRDVSKKQPITDDYIDYA